MGKIIVNREVRSLLHELDEVMEKLYDQTRALTTTGISESAAMNIGLEREATNTVIRGIVYRLHKASTGKYRHE